MNANPLIRAFVGRKDMSILFIFAILAITFCVVCLGMFYIFGLVGLAAAWLAFGLSGYIARQLQSSPFFSEGWLVETETFMAFALFGPAALLIHIKLDYLDLALKNTEG